MAWRIGRPRYKEENKIVRLALCEGLALLEDYGIISTSEINRLSERTALWAQSRLGKNHSVIQMSLS